MAEEINTINDCLVGATRGGIVVMGLRDKEFLERDRALRLAAWIVALAETKPGEFDEVLSAVRNT